MHVQFFLYSSTQLIGKTLPMFVGGEILKLIGTDPFEMLTYLVLNTNRFFITKMRAPCKLYYIDIIALYNTVATETVCNDTSIVVYL